MFPQNIFQFKEKNSVASFVSSCQFSSCTSHTGPVFHYRNFAVVPDVGISKINFTRRDAATSKLTDFDKIRRSSRTEAEKTKG